MAPPGEGVSARDDDDDVPSGKPEKGGVGGFQLLAPHASSNPRQLSAIKITRKLAPKIVERTIVGINFLELFWI